MWNKIKRAITDNFQFKILALLFAVALWMVVVNVDDPDQTKTFTTTVQVINENVLTEQGKYYTIANNNNTVSFRVTAKRSVLEKLSSSDFTAVADMRNLEEDKRIPVEVSVNRYTSEVLLSAKRLYLEVEVGNEMNNKFVIRGETTGEPAEGYAVDEVSVSPNVISVKGPEEYVSQIESVKAFCDVSNINTDITESVVPVFYDEKGKEVDTTKLEVSMTTVDISVRIVSTKEVAVTVDTEDLLAEGVELSKVTTDPTSVAIKGESSVLNSVTSIEIPASVLSMAEVTQDITTTVDITSYLPEGVTLLDPNDAQVTVNIKVSGAVSQKYQVPTANLAVRNLSDGLNASLEGDTIEITITALPSQLARLSEGTISGYVDVSGLAPGTHPVPVMLNLDDDYKVSPATIRVTITE